MYTYAWDLNEEGVETVLARYRECGSAAAIGRDLLRSLEARGDD